MSDSAAILRVVPMSSFCGDVPIATSWVTITGVSAFHIPARVIITLIPNMADMKHSLTPVGNGGGLCVMATTPLISLKISTTAVSINPYIIGDM